MKNLNVKLKTYLNVKLLTALLILKFLKVNKISKTLERVSFCFFLSFFFPAWVPVITLKIVFHNLLKKRYSRTIIGPSYQITRIHWKQPRDRASHRLIFYEESRKQKNFLLCESRKIKIILRKSIFWYQARIQHLKEVSQVDEIAVSFCFKFWRVWPLTCIIIRAKVSAS